jgi:hypothetical protein
MADWNIHQAACQLQAALTTIDTGKPIVYAARDKKLSVQTASGITRYEYTVVSSQAEFDEKMPALVRDRL